MWSDFIYFRQISIICLYPICWFRFMKLHGHKLMSYHCHLHEGKIYYMNNIKVVIGILQECFRVLVHVFFNDHWFYWDLFILTLFIYIFFTLHFFPFLPFWMLAWFFFYLLAPTICQRTMIWNSLKIERSHQRFMLWCKNYDLPILENLI